MRFKTLRQKWLSEGYLDSNLTACEAVLKCQHHNKKMHEIKIEGSEILWSFYFHPQLTWRVPRSPIVRSIWRCIAIFCDCHYVRFPWNAWWGSCWLQRGIWFCSIRNLKLGSIWRFHVFFGACSRWMTEVTGGMFRESGMSTSYAKLWTFFLIRNGPIFTGLREVKHGKVYPVSPSFLAKHIYTLPSSSTGLRCLL